MTVDRKYSIYKEVREYQDREMQKWQGFYLSEHGAALKKDALQVSSVIERKYSQEELLIYLNQFYLNKSKVQFIIKRDLQVKEVEGQIYEILKLKDIFLENSRNKKIEKYSLNEIYDFRVLSEDIQSNI